MNEYLEILKTPEHLTFFIINVLMFLFAKFITDFVEHDKTKAKIQFKVLITFNIIFLIIHLIDVFLIIKYPEYSNFMLKVGMSILILYMGYLCSLGVTLFNKRKFGELKNIEEKMRHVDNATSRFINIIFQFVLFILVIITIINYWGFKSLLESTSVLGIIGVMVFITSQTWVPSLISGMILLNDGLFKEGDIIVIDDEYYMVYELEYFRIILKNVKNNHKVSMDNIVFKSKILENISKIAGLDGIRESINYNIGYNINYKLNQKEREKQIKYNKDLLEYFLKEAFEELSKDKNVDINSERHESFELLLLEAGADALTYEVSFYLNKMKNVNTTAKARRFLRRKYLVNQKIFEKAVKYGVDLSTPKLIDIV